MGPDRLIFPNGSFPRPGDDRVSGAENLVPVRPNSIHKFPDCQTGKRSFCELHKAISFSHTNFQGDRGGRVME